MSDGIKPTYDARNQYYDVMKLLMIGTKNASLNARLEDWHRGLWSLFNMVCSYIDQTEAAKLKESLIAARGKLMQLEATNRRDPQMRQAHHHKKWEVELLLLNLEEELHRAARNVMLPTSTDAGDLDIDEMLRRQGQ